MKENLQDVWQVNNPTSRDYTYYSSVHKSFSRIDMMWASQEIEILPKTKSDHKPIFWQEITRKTAYRWRLNEDLLLQEENLEFIQKQTEYFFLRTIKKTIQGYQ